jgi:hypothetical protein
MAGRASTSRKSQVTPLVAFTKRATALSRDGGQLAASTGALGLPPAYMDRSAG